MANIFGNDTKKRAAFFIDPRAKSLRLRKAGTGTDKKRRCQSLFFAVFFIAAIIFALGASASALEPGKLVSTSDKKFTFHAMYQNARVEVTLLTGGIVKVEAFAPEIFSSFPSYLTVDDGPQPLWFSKGESALKLTAGDTAVEIGGGAFGLTFDGADGKPLLEMPAGALQWKDDGGYSFSFNKAAGDHYLGLGEPLPDPLGRVITYDNKKSVRAIWNMHLPPADMGIPFFYNPRGYGLFMDNPWKAEFDFTGQGVFTYRAEGGPARFYFIPGPDAYSVLERYTALTGRAPIPPRWSTGYMQSRFGYQNEKDYRGLMDNFRGRKLPCDVLIFDLDWFGDGMMGNLWWNSTNFPDGAKFQDELASRGFKSITIVEPYMFMTSTNYKEAHAKKLLTRTVGGSTHMFPFWGGSLAGLMDFSNPSTQRWFGDKVARIHDSGVDAWWTDLDEPETEFKETYYLLGRREGAHNLEAFLMNKSIHDMYARRYPDERPFIMSRSGFAGIQRFGTSVWSGDVTASFQHLSNQIPIGLSTSLSGIPLWNSDTGGFHNKPSTELYVRWFQFSSFCPVFRSHGNHTEREPFSFGGDAENICRKFLELRYRLAPYLYSLFRRMNQTGAPIMIPTFMEFPSDADALLLNGQYLYGPWLLVAPVVKEGASQKKVHIPPGEWTSLWDESVVSGPGDISVPVDLSTMPVFVREGALLPLGPVMQYMEEKPVDPLTVHYYPSARETSFVVYEDDGATRGYERGEFAETILRGSYTPGAAMSVKAEGPNGKYKGMLESRGYEIVFHHCDRLAGVLLNGAAVPEANWKHDAAAKTLTVSVPDSKGNFTVDVKLK